MPSALPAPLPEAETAALAAALLASDAAEALCPRRCTPGPWQQFSAQYDPYTIVGAIDGPDEGRMKFREVARINDALDPDEAYANACAIAALPDLIDVAIGAALVLVEMRDLIRDAGFAPPASYEALARKVAPALAKARGEL
jgi:hypothetical protein